MLNYEKVREVAKPMPRNLLVPIISVLAAVHNISDGVASIPELCDSLGECFDKDTMIIYRGLGYGLAYAFDGNPYDEHSGYNERADLICELFNGRYWEGEGHGDIQASRHERLDAIDFLMTKKDATLLAERLWMRFFDENREFQYADLCANISNNEGVSNTETEVDPSDLPLELDAANMAFRAVSNGYGNQSDTFKNRLIDYLQKTYTDLKTEAVQRIATVANPDKTTGRKKRDKE